MIWLEARSPRVLPRHKYKPGALRKTVKQPLMYQILKIMYGASFGFIKYVEFNEVLKKQLKHILYFPITVIRIITSVSDPIF